MNSCQFKEIIVVEDFEAENGALGLGRDIYLSLVKFRFINRKESMSD
jgi:hypothetical protein